MSRRAGRGRGRIRNTALCAVVLIAACASPTASAGDPLACGAGGRGPCPGFVHPQVALSDGNGAAGPTPDRHFMARSLLFGAPPATPAGERGELNAPATGSTAYASRVAGRMRIVNLWNSGAHSLSLTAGHDHQAMLQWSTALGGTSHGDALLNHLFGSAP